MLPTDLMPGFSKKKVIVLYIEILFPVVRWRNPNEVFFVLATHA